MIRSFILFLAMCAFCFSAAATQLATVNGRPITDKDLQTALSSYNEGTRDNILKDKEFRRQMLNTVVEQEIMIQQAEKEKMDQDQEYKDAQLKFRKSYLISRMISKVLTGKVTDRELKKYYDNHKIDFNTDKVHAQHILLEDEKSARDVLKRAKQPGVDFQELAEKYSKDNTVKTNRGDVGIITRGTNMDPAFLKAAMEAPSGEIVGPVHTAFGYHVIRIVEKVGGKPLEFSEVEQQVRAVVQQKLIRNYVEKLRDTAKVHIDEKALEKL